MSVTVVRMIEARRRGVVAQLDQHDRDGCAGYGREYHGRQHGAQHDEG